MNTRTPTIISTSPSNYQKDIPINTSIRMEFNIDLDSRYVNEHVFMTDSTGTPVEIRTNYRSKVITITPLQPLYTGATYQVTVIGDSNLDDAEKKGIRSIIGDCMRGNYTFTFTTEKSDALQPPTVLFPINQTIVREAPEFTWEALDGAAGYYFELAKTNNFDTLVYSNKDAGLIRVNLLQPDVELEDGIYYWRLQAVNEDGVKGEWSRDYQFKLATQTTGTISDDDAPPADDYPYQEEIELELVEEFPKDLSTIVPTNVKTLYFRVIGDINVNLLDDESITLVGKHISGDFEEESHGLVNGRITILEHTDGTSYILFTPDVLPTETVGES